VPMATFHPKAGIHTKARNHHKKRAGVSPGPSL
jgi:hypothetical protein